MNGDVFPDVAQPFFYWTIWPIHNGTTETFEVREKHYEETRPGFISENYEETRPGFISVNYEETRPGFISVNYF